MNSSDLQHPVDVRDILPDTYDGNTIINCPPWAFKPDQWTRAFLRGVAKLDLRDAVSAEAGVGPGTNQLYVTRVQKPGISYGSDLDGRLPKVASANVLRAAGQEAQQRFTPIHGNQSLLSWIVRQRLDVVLACIPQVPADHHDEETLAQVRKFAATVNGNGTDVQTDALSHYYDPDTYVSDLNVFGLGLNDHLLQQARGVLRAKGKAILNLGGRPGRATLEHLSPSTFVFPASCALNLFVDLKYLPYFGCFTKRVTSTTIVSFIFVEATTPVRVFLPTLLLLVCTVFITF
jgi:SAM-dependent methyltransferase